MIHCGGVDGERLAADLPGEVGRCLGSGASAVVVDLDPWAPDRRPRASRRCAPPPRRSRRPAASWSWPSRSRRPARRSPAPASCAPCRRRRVRPEGDADAPTAPSAPAALGARVHVSRRRRGSCAPRAGASPPSPRWPACDGADLFELNVAVAEALANAVVHGSPHGADDDVRVRFFCYEDEVAVEVVDGGDGMAATPICAPPAAATSGRGHPLHARAGRRRALHVRSARHASTLGQAALVRGGGCRRRRLPRRRASAGPVGCDGNAACPTRRRVGPRAQRVSGARCGSRWDHAGRLMTGAAP